MIRRLLHTRPWLRMSFRAPKRCAAISSVDSPPGLVSRCAPRDDKGIAQSTVKPTMISREIPFFLSLMVLISHPKQYQQVILTDLAS